MSANQELHVTTHVGRDLLASAASFKTEASVVWEYVVNSLQYVEPGVAPRVQVQTSAAKDEIAIADNGRGMSAEDLRHFFRMHGENLDRLAGRAGRGKFGTGKSAAFGIANSLRVDTVREQKRNVVHLTRSMIENSDGREIPVEWEIRDAPTSVLNGTLIVISDLNIPKIRVSPIIEYVERHLQAFRANSPQVAIDNHVCVYREPEIEDEFTFYPSASQAEVLRNVCLKIKVAKAPLPTPEQGISITAGIGNMVAIERAGIEIKEFGNYLFGEIDIPSLETHPSPIEPFDPTRSLQLNPQHPVAAVLLGFLGSKLEEVRFKLVSRAKEARKTEQARRLARQADKIAQILNEDFRRVSDRLHEIKAASSRMGSAGSQFGSRNTGDKETDSWVRGTQEPGLTTPRAEPSKSGTGSTGTETPDIPATGTPETEGPDALDPVGGRGDRKKPRGGFSVEYRQLGKAEERSRYDRTTLTILINLDHKLVEAALGDGSVEDIAFRRLSYELAFSEYAMALGYEISEQDPNIPADDLLFEVRSTLNRISSAAVDLYR